MCQKKKKKEKNVWLKNSFDGRVRFFPFWKCDENRQFIISVYVDKIDDQVLFFTAFSRGSRKYISFEKIIFKQVIIFIR